MRDLARSASRRRRRAKALRGGDVVRRRPRSREEARFAGIHLRRRDGRELRPDRRLADRRQGPHRRLVTDRVRADREAEAELRRGRRHLRAAPRGLPHDQPRDPPGLRAGVPVDGPARPGDRAVRQDRQDLQGGAGRLLRARRHLASEEERGEGLRELRAGGRDGAVGHELVDRPGKREARAFAVGRRGKSVSQGGGPGSEVDRRRLGPRRGRVREEGLRRGRGDPPARARHRPGPRGHTIQPRAGREGPRPRRRRAPDLQRARHRLRPRGRLPGAPRARAARGRFPIRSKGAS